MARLRLPVVAEAIDSSGRKRPAAGATISYFEPGTAAVTAGGTAVTGTAFQKSLYAALTGGSPISTTQTADSNGQKVVYADYAGRCDVGIVYNGVAAVRQYEAFEVDPGDIETYHVERNRFGYRLVAGDITAASANTTALNNLILAVGATGRGRIQFGTGIYWLAPGVRITHASASGVPISLFGVEGRDGTHLALTGTTGPWFDFGVDLPVGGSISRSMFKDFVVEHGDEVPTSGATFKIRTDADIFFENVEQVDAHIAVETVRAFQARNCTFTLKTSGTPTGLLINNTVDAGAVKLENVVINGTNTRIGIGIDFQNAALWDTTELNAGCFITGMDHAIRKVTGAGNVVNTFLNDTIIDVNNTWCINLVPPAPAEVGTFHVDNGWMSAGATGGFVNLSTAAGGAITGFYLRGANLTNGATDGISINGAAVVDISNVTMGMEAVTTNRAGIRVLAGRDIKILNDTISMGTGATASVYVADVVDPVEVDHVDSRNADIVFLGPRSRSRKLGRNNVYAGGIFSTAPSPASTSLDGPRQDFAAQLGLVLSDIRLVWLPWWTDTTSAATLETNAGRAITWDATVASRLTAQGEHGPLQTFTTLQFGHTPDTANLSFGDGATDQAVTFWVLGNVTDTATTRTIVSKYDSGAFEWVFQVTSADRLELRFVDHSTLAAAFRTSDAAITMGSPVLLTAVYDGTGGATAANGITLLQNAATIASTATNNSGGVYTAMENGATRVEIGSQQAAAQHFMFGSMGLVMVSAGAATAKQVTLVKRLLNSYFGLAL